MLPCHHWGICLPLSSQAFWGRRSVFKSHASTADPTQSYTTSNVKDKGLALSFLTCVGRPCVISCGLLRQQFHPIKKKKKLPITLNYSYTTYARYTRVNQLRTSKVLHWNTTPQSTKMFVRPRRHLTIFEPRRTPADEPGVQLWFTFTPPPGCFSLTFLKWGSCAERNAETSSLMLARFWPQASPAGCRTIPAEPQGYLPYALQHLFPRKSVSSSTGLYESSELVRANQPSWNPKHWRVQCQKAAEQDRQEQWTKHIKKIHKLSFLFWTKISAFAIQYFCSCKEDLQYKSEEKSLQKTLNVCCSSFILPTLTGLF